MRRYVPGVATEAQTITIQPWTGPWAEDDPDANFKAEVALYAGVDPLSTLTNLGRALDIPVGALVHYVLAKWASEGSAALLELGPSMARKLLEMCDAAERAADDGARLEAYRGVRARISWLNAPLD